MITIISQETQDRSNLLMSLLNGYLESTTEKEKNKILKEINDNNCVLVEYEFYIRKTIDEIIKAFHEKQKKCYVLPDIYGTQLYEDKILESFVKVINNMTILYDKDSNMYYALNTESKSPQSIGFKLENNVCTYYNLTSFLSLGKKNDDSLDLFQTIIKENGEVYYAEKIINVNNTAEDEPGFINQVARYLEVAHTDESSKETEEDFPKGISQKLDSFIAAMNSKVKHIKCYRSGALLFKSIEYENGYTLNIMHMNHKKYGSNIYYAITNGTPSNYFASGGCWKLYENYSIARKMCIYKLNEKIN